MRTPYPLLLAAAVVAPITVLPAQGTIVSPTFNATTEGTSSSTVPLATTGARRVLQIHGDLGTTPRMFTKLAFRMNASTTNYTGTRAIDMELYVGPTVPASRISFLYDQNYVGPRVQAIARRIVNFGPQGQAVSPGPNPFTSNMDLMFDAPVAYSGTTAFGWDSLVYSNTATGTSNSLDGELGSQTTGASVITGTPGCICTGRTAAMTHTVAAVDTGGILALNFTITNGPNSAPVLLAIGASNPNLPVAGLCANVFSDVLLLPVIGTTSATGSITSTQAGLSTFVLPNTIPGGTLFTQALAIDTGRADPIPLCASNGRQITIPTSDLSRAIDVSRVYNNSNTTTPPEAGFISTFTVGFGIVTEFTYQ